MSLTSLKSLNQGDFLGATGYSAGGVCYYMSEYVQEKIWCRPPVGSFDAALEATKKVIPVTIINAAKAKNLTQKAGRAVAQDQYGKLTTPLKINSLYRVGLWFGEAAQSPTDADHQNHEAILITGSNADVILLEPNFGFYQGVVDAANVTNKDIFEAGVKDLYLGISHHAQNFHYQRIRGL